MKKIIIITLTLLCAVAIAGYKMYNKSHRSVKDEKGIVITSIELFSAFEKNEDEANQMYLDKVVEVRGIVSETLTNQDGKSVLILSTNNPMFGVSCTMENEGGNISIGSSLAIKGICTGYLSDVVITRGIIEKN